MVLSHGQRHKDKLKISPELTPLLLISVTVIVDQSYRGLLAAFGLLARRPELNFCRYITTVIADPLKGAVRFTVHQALSIYDLQACNPLELCLV